jgi:peptide/histidine transporter 3/4
MCLGYCGFQANIIQFGTDQLIDASSTEIKSFIAWCSWTFFASELAMDFLLTCTDNKLFAPLLICCNLTVAVVINILFKDVLVKEPPTQNPFKLVYKVLVYAIRNKCPRQRSAFTYCEDGIPSRIDFGKRKYGGPFTTEQVENVKTLFRVSALCFVGCGIFAFTETWSSLKLAVNSLFRNRDAIEQFSKCSSEYIITGMYFISATILIPLYELIINPVFHHCLINSQSSWKFISGAIIGMVRLIAYASLIVKARHNHSVIDNNSTLQCSFHEPPGALGTYIDYRWIALLQFFNVTSDLLIIIGMLEFYCAQVPYSMKGIVAGVAYSIIVLYLPVCTAIEKVFEKPSLTWRTGEISCEFWYFVTLLAIVVILLAIFFIVLKWYKKRKREDVLPNEQIFAERYYSYLN